MGGFGISPPGAPRPLFLLGTLPWLRSTFGLRLN